MLIDPVEAWYLRNTGQRLTPVGGVRDERTPAIPAPERLPWGDPLEARAPSTRGNPTRPAGPTRPGGLTIGQAPPGAERGLVRSGPRSNIPMPGMGPDINPLLWSREEDKRASDRAQRAVDESRRLASEGRAAAQQRRNQQAKALNDLRMERLSRIEGLRRESLARAAERTSERLRQIADQQARYRVSVSRASQAIPLQADQISKALSEWGTTRPGNWPAALAPPSWKTPQGVFTTGVRVGPGQAPGRATVKRDPDGSRDGGQYYALRPRMNVTWGAPKYLENDQFMYGLNMTDAQVRNLQLKLLERGYFSTHGQIAYIPGKYDAFTREAVELAMRLANETGDSIQTLLSAPSRYNADGSPYGPGPGGDGPRTVKDVQKVYDITSLDRGSLTLRAIMARELGRQPTAAEVKNYVAQLNARERANPDIITTTSTRNASGSFSTSTQIKEGKRPEPEEQAIGFSKAGEVGKERQEFQEARYYEMLVDLIGGEGAA